MFLWLAHHQVLTAFLLLIILLAIVVAGLLGALHVDRDGVAGAFFVAGLITSIGVTAYLSTLVEHAWDGEVSAAVHAKYGSQVTKIGKIPTRGSATSTWVIDDARVSCTLDVTDATDPLVTCGTELPLAAVGH